MKTTVTIVRHVEVDIDDKFEILNCDIVEYNKRLNDGRITDKIVDDCIAEVEAKTGILSYDDNFEYHTDERFVLVETKDNSILEF